jgi:hydroxypyruvate isomerase
MNRREFGHGVLAATGAALTAPGFGSAASAGPASRSLPFKLSVMLWTILPKEPIDKRVTVVADAGYHAIQLDDEFHGWNAEDCRRFRQRCSTLGLAVDAIVLDSPGMALPNRGTELVVNLKKTLEVADRLACQSIIVLSGDRVAEMTEAMQRSVCIDNLRRSGDIAAAQGVTLLLENINAGEDPKYFVQRAADGFDIVKAADHPHVRMLYDLYHEQLMAGNLIAKLKEHTAVLGLVHVADVPGRHEPGTGEINYENIFRTLVELGFSHSVAMEFHPTKDPVVSLREARQLAETCATGGPA